MGNINNSNTVHMKFFALIAIAAADPICADLEADEYVEDTCLCAGDDPDAKDADCPAEPEEEVVEEDEEVVEDEGDEEDDGDISLDDLGCESADDCGEDEICATTDIDEVDTEHELYDETTDELTQALFPLSLCTTQEECDAAAEEEQEDSPYTISISCGATKLVASFAALALASAM